MIILTDTGFRKSLFPFTETRHAADIRIGILTIREKWELLTGEKVTTDENAQGVKIPANIIPTQDNAEALLAEAVHGVFEASETIRIIHHARDIFLLNDYALRCDFDLLTKGRHSAHVSNTNRTVMPENIFAEEGAVIEHAFLNASTGPIYIGKNAEIMEGNMIRGPFSIGENSKLKMGSKIYGAVTIGPDCIAGGEIKNSVFFANSNKAHDGYLGDSVLGEWCNLGAGTSNSNVKNTGGDVMYAANEESPSFNAGGKAGLLMGDYSRAAINTSFNTGSIVGVCCNIFGNNTPLKYTKNFTWGNERYIFEKAIRDIRNWKKMKGQDVTKSEIEKLEKLYNDRVI